MMNAETATPESTVDAAPRDLRARTHFVLGRVAYWLPVIAALILFAQVSFLGLRPALAEAGRLADAEGVLSARHARAVALNREIQLQLVARQDPLYRERQRRARTNGAGAAQHPQAGN